MAAGLIHRLQDAYECDLATTDDGWAMAAACMGDVDEGFVANMDADREWEEIKATLLPGVTYQDWIDAYLALRPTLRLVESRSGRVTSLHTANAEQFSGLAVSGGPTPAFIWTCLDAGQWGASVHVNGETRTLESGPQVLQDPAIARGYDGALWLAWVRREDDGDIIHVVDESGSVAFRLPGRHPSLAAVPGGVAVCYERSQDGENRTSITRRCRRGL